jgi:hypothetical protein
LQNNSSKRQTFDIFLKNNGWNTFATHCVFSLGNAFH